MLKTKACTKCGRELLANSDYFYRNKNAKDGLASDCRECRGSKFTNKAQCKKGHKICNKCGRALPITDEYFYKDKRKKDGYRSNCIDCEKESNRQYYEKNPEWYKKYYEENKEKYSIRHKEWLEENKERRAESRKEYYVKNKEKIAEYRKQYWEDNKEKLSKQKSVWRKANAEKIRVSKQQRRAKKEQLPATLTKTEWNKIKLYFNNSCAYCGVTEKEHLKHAGERLHQEHFLSVGNGGEYTHNNIIPSCRACNSSKGENLFNKWYPTYKYYNEDRKNKILEFLGYNEKQEQQLTLIL